MPAGQPAPSSTPIFSVDQQRAILWRRISVASDWWFWIAGLTAVNTGAVFAHSTWGFALGTEVVDYVNWTAVGNPGIKVAALCIDAVIIGLIALWGVLCKKGFRWAFWSGMVLYGLDTILALYARQWIDGAFHAYAIYSIYQGVAAAGLLKKLEAAVAQQQQHYAQSLTSAPQPSPASYDPFSERSPFDKPPGG